MAKGRPAKSVKLQSSHLTKEDAAARAEIEDALRGDGGALEPPGWLSEGQREVFGFVVAEMAAAEVLGNLDAYVLTQFAVATERLFDIERRINESPGMVQDKDLIFARNSYVKDFWRGASELSLSPQARSKIGSLWQQRREKESDPLARLLEGKG